MIFFNAADKRWPCRIKVLFNMFWHFVAYAKLTCWVCMNHTEEKRNCQWRLTVQQGNDMFNADGSVVFSLVMVTSSDVNPNGISPPSCSKVLLVFFTYFLPQGVNGLLMTAWSVFICVVELHCVKKMTGINSSSSTFLWWTPSYVAVKLSVYCQQQLLHESDAPQRGANVILLLFFLMNVHHDTVSVELENINK